MKYILMTAYISLIFGHLLMGLILFAGSAWDGALWLWSTGGIFIITYWIVTGRFWFKAKVEL